MEEREEELGDTIEKEIKCQRHKLHLEDKSLPAMVALCKPHTNGLLSRFNVLFCHLYTYV